MTPIFDVVLDVLRDGNYHSFNELLSKTGLSRLKLEATVKFLEAYDFVYYRTAYLGSTVQNKVKLTTPMMNFLRRCPP